MHKRRDIFAPLVHVTEDCLSKQRDMRVSCLSPVPLVRRPFPFPVAV